MAATRMARKLGANRARNKPKPHYRCATETVSTPNKDL